LTVSEPGRTRSRASSATPRRGVGSMETLLGPLFVGGEPATTRARAAGSKWCMPRCSTATASPRSQPFPRSHRAHAHIAGPPDLAKKLFDLPEGTRVHVEGAIERRSHTFLLGVVNPVHAAPTQQ